MDNLNKKILITGGSGYIGRNLIDNLQNKYYVYSIGRRFLNLKNYFVCDITNNDNLKKIIVQIQPDVVIHCAGISNLVFCEKHPDITWEVNFEGTKNLIKTLKSFGLEVKFIFLSSDYVFNGKTGNYKEDDIPSPITVYGKVKYEIEKLIQQEFSNYTICRTANVYGNGGGSFFNFVIDNLKCNKKIEIFEDTFFTPTQINNLIEMIDLIVTKDIRGILHTVGAERINRYNFAKKIARRFNLNDNLIIPTSRPSNSLIAYDSSLNSEKTQRLLGIKFLTIDEGLKNL